MYANATCFVQAPHGPSRRWLLPLLLLAACLGGCGPYSSVTVVVTPDRITLARGEQATVTLRTMCDIECNGSLFDYVVHNVPTGVTYSVDASLQSASTPGVVRMTFDAGSTAEAGVHDVAIHVRPTADSEGGRTILPVHILPSEGFVPLAEPVAIAAGRSHSLALLSDGTVMAWGNNEEGQLGTGDVRGHPAPVPLIVPVDIRLTDELGLFAGGDASGAVDAAGRLWTWGSNSRGELGLGDFRHRSAPSRVAMPENVRTVRFGGGHHFGLMLTADGSVWGSGFNGDGELGVLLSSRTVEPWPVIVQGMSGLLDVTAGGSHALGLAQDRTVWSWGSGSSGQLGRAEVGPPAPIPMLSDVTAVSAGSDYSLSLDASGTVWAWGANSWGQLGDGGDGGDVRETPRPVAGLPPIGNIAAGFEHALAAALDGESVWAWGRNSLGQTGAGGGDRALPARVPNIRGIRAIAAGGNHSLALSTCGQIWAFGDNAYGQLGDGTRSRPPEPVPLPYFDDSACERVGLKVHVIGGGVRVGVLGEAAARTCTDAFSCSAVFDRGTTVELTAFGGGELEFDGWRHDCSGSSPTTTVVLSRSMRCVASYRPPPEPDLFLLTVLSPDGRVVSSGGGLHGPSRIDCGQTCDAIFPAGTSVTLTAEPSEDAEFVRWSLDCSGTTLQTSVAIDRRTSCRAEFQSTAELPPVESSFAVSVQLSNQGGPDLDRVFSIPAGISCLAGGGTASVCTAEFSDPQIQLVAEPADVADPSAFQAWGGCTQAQGTTCLIDNPGDGSTVAIGASFQPPSAPAFQLDFQVFGPGRIRTDPSGILCTETQGTCALQFPQTPISVIVEPDAGAVVQQWGGDCAGWAPSTLSFDFVITRHLSCSVGFAPAPTSGIALNIVPHADDARLVDLVVTGVASDRYAFFCNYQGSDQFPSFVGPESTRTCDYRELPAGTTFAVRVTTQEGDSADGAYTLP